VVTRVFVAVAAIAVLAWLGTMERGVRLQARGVAAAEQPDFAQAEANFRRARFLSPDTLPDLRRAFVYQGSGRSEQAAAVLEDVLRREPENLGAWRLLLIFTRDRDPVTARRAVAALRRLDPISATRR
jgi:hypothetical protein